jgi:hypothetical protein
MAGMDPEAKTEMPGKQPGRKGQSPLADGERKRLFPPTGRQSTAFSARELIPIALLALVIAAAVFALTPRTDFEGGWDSDGRMYGAMAGDPALAARAHQAPWCYRVLAPFLASLLPLPALDAFRCLAFVGAAAALPLLYLCLRLSGFTSAISLLGLFLYAGVFWTVKFPAYSPAYPDYLTQCLLLGLLALALSGRLLWIPPLLALAALHKEAFLPLSLAVYVAWRRGQGLLSPGGLRSLVLHFLLPVAVVLVGLRLLIVPENHAFQLLSVVGYVRDFLRPEPWPRLLAATISGLGLIPFILLLRPGAARGFLATAPGWTALAVIGLILLAGGCDKARIFLYALPALVAATAAVARSLHRETTSARFSAWLFLTLAAHFFLGWHLSPMGDFNEYLARMVPEHAPGLSYIRPAALMLGVAASWFAASCLLLGAPWRKPRSRAA